MNRRNAGSTNKPQRKSHDESDQDHESGPTPASHANTFESFAVLLQGTSVVLIGLALRVGLVFMAELIAARYLGPVRYGLLSWGIAVVSVGSMLSMFGLGTAARRFIPIQRLNGNSAAVRGTILTTAALVGMGGLVALILLLTSAEMLTLRLFGDAAELPILEVLVFALPFWNLFKVFLAFAAGFKQVGIKVWVEDLFVPLGLLTSVLVVATLGYGPREIAMGYVGVYIAAAAIFGLLIRFRTPYREIAAVSPRYSTREILSFSWPLIFTETLGKATGIIDIFIIGMLTVAADVGMYRVASDLAVIMSVILICFGYFYLPIASEHFARRDYAGWAAINSRVARWAMLCSFPFFSVLFFKAEQVLDLLYGADYAEASPVLMILAVSYFLHAAVGFTGSNLVVAGHTRWQLTAHVTALVVKIVGFSVMIPLAGIRGAALVTLASICVTNGVNLVVSFLKYGLHPFGADHTRAWMSLMAGAWLLHQGTERFVLGPLGTVSLFILGMAALIFLLIASGLLVDDEDRKLFVHLRRRVSKHE